MCIFEHLHDSFCCFLTWNVSSDSNCTIDEACSLCFPFFLRGSEGLLVYCVNILWLLMQHWMVAKLYSHYQSWIRKGVVVWGVPLCCWFCFSLLAVECNCSWLKWSCLLAAHFVVSYLTEGFHLSRNLKRALPYTHRSLRLCILQRNFLLLYGVNVSGVT